MNVYVDELPNCCGNCGFCCKDDLGYWCQSERLVYIADELVGKKRLQSCPLLTITDYEKQVRKQVCSEIGGEIYTQMIVYGKELRYSDLNLILDQIEKGEQYENTKTKKR